MNTNYRLDDLLALLNTQKKFLREKFGVTDVAIFGSYANNLQRENSDIDIFVQIRKDSKTFDNFMDLKFYLEELFDHRKVDLVIKESIREELKPSIFREAVHA